MKSKLTWSVMAMVLFTLSLLISCKNKTIKFEPTGTVKDVHGLDQGLPIVAAYNVSYNPNGNSIVTIYLRLGNMPDTFRTKPFNNPAHLAAMIALFHADSILTFDKVNNEFHYTQITGHAKAF